MQNIVRQIHKLLLKSTLTIAVAESCTGGLLSSLLTRHSGSSAYFMLGTVVYSNRAKNMILKISRSVITRHGAVSSPVAEAMANAIRRIAKTDLGIGITGIAGPTGGTKQKPVGTVYIAAACKTRTICRKYSFKGTRPRVRTQSCAAALRMIAELVQ